MPDTNTLNPNYIAEWTEAVWENYTWNPPQYGEETVADLDASPKPTWSFLLDGFKELGIHRTLEHLGLFLQTSARETNAPARIRARLTDAAHVTLADGQTADIGDGLDQITAIQHAVENATTAGAMLPHTVFRDAAGKQKPLWTERQQRAILRAASLREIEVHAADAVVQEAIQKQRDIAEDASRTLDDREEAAGKALAMAEDYENLLNTAIAAYDPDTLPPDLETRKAVYRARIEQAAMARVDYLTDAESQQGVDLPASCDDQENALRKVSRRASAGKREVAKTTTLAAADTAYNAAVQSIQEVEALNVPVWKVGNRDLASNPARTVKRMTSPLEVTAHNPDRVAAGAITIRVSQKGGPRLRIVPFEPGGDSDGIRITWPPGATDDIDLEIRAVNLCGPALLMLRLSPPTP